MIVFNHLSLYNTFPVRFNNLKPHLKLFNVLRQPKDTPEIPTKFAPETIIFWSSGSIFISHKWYALELLSLAGSSSNFLFGLFYSSIGEMGLN